MGTYAQIVGYIVIISISVSGVIYGAAWLVLDAFDRIHKNRPWMMWVATKTLWMASTRYRRRAAEPWVIARMLRKHADEIEKSIGEGEGHNDDN